jgi:hypothetical protein
MHRVEREVTAQTSPLLGFRSREREREEVHREKRSMEQQKRRPRIGTGPLSFDEPEAGVKFKEQGQTTL